MKLIKLGIGFVVACASFVGMVGESYAGQSISQNVEFSIELTSGCTISATGMAFPSVPVSNPDITNADAGSVDITCTNNTAYKWGFDRGMNYSGGRRMIGDNHGGLLSYTLLYSGTAVGDDGIDATDTGYTETTTGVNAVSGVGTGAPQSLPLKANIATSAQSTADIYSDTVQVVIAW